jgi:succinyl-CoA synthetase alpha subunit
MLGIDNIPRVVVQGITGHQGSIHSAQMRAFGTNVVAGVVPGKGGASVGGVQVFDSVMGAIQKTGADTSVIFVPAMHCLDAVIEGIEAGIGTIVVVTEHVPLRDAIVLRNLSKRKGTVVIGPNSPGIGVPGHYKLGIMPNQIFLPGHVGVISRSGTLTYELVQSMTELGIGQRCCVGVGGDQIPGTSMTEVAKEFCLDDEIRAILLIGEVGGNAEAEAANMLADRFDGSVHAFLAGRSAPPGKRMGHAGAIMSEGTATIQEKADALTKIGVKVCQRMENVATELKSSLAAKVH